MMPTSDFLWWYWYYSADGNVVGDLASKFCVPKEQVLKRIDELKEFLWYNRIKW
jgi:hypothetical protein